MEVSITFIFMYLSSRPQSHLHIPTIRSLYLTQRSPSLCQRAPYPHRGADAFGETVVAQGLALRQGRSDVADGVVVESRAE